MKKIIFASCIACSILLLGCNTSRKLTIPYADSLELDDTYTIIWNGISKAYRYTNGQWERAENYDYQFDVVQKRYENHWKSVKSLHRIHPDYDGKAGDRDQTMYFDVVYEQLKNDSVHAILNTSLGKGTGTTDIEFRNSSLTINVADASSFMPYNMFRITQKYDYEKGVLTETVELIKENDGIEVPFMKNEETAFIFVKQKLDKAPTVFKK